jgi:hypothetical protein
MKEKIMSEDKKTTFPSAIDWKSLDTIVRQWAVMSQFEQDQENYQNLKSQYE